MGSYYEVNFLEGDFPLHAWKGKGFSFPAHWHEELEWVFVTSGVLQVKVNNHLYQVKENESIFLGMNHVHQYIEETPCTFVMMKFNLRVLEGMHLDMESYGFLLSMFHHTHLFNASYSKTFREQLGKAMVEICEEIESELQGFKYGILHVMYQVLTLLLREGCLNEIVVELEAHNRPNHMVTFALSYIEKNYNKPLTLEDMAKAIHLSKNYFSKVFKAHTGMSFMQCLRAYRLQKARELLVETDWTVMDIALQCGFNSIKTFNRLFVKSLGVSPTKYRRMIFEK